MTPEPEGEIERRIRSLLERATVALTEAARDRLLCAISRSGAPLPAVKYREGAIDALEEAKQPVG